LHRQTRDAWAHSEIGYTKWCGRWGFLRHYLHKRGLAPPLKNLTGQLHFTGTAENTCTSTHKACTHAHRETHSYLERERVCPERAMWGQRTSWIRRRGDWATCRYHRSAI
jgi:hypothetical protein